MISNSGHDENGKYNGGTAGDQTGGEWQIQAWYNRPWNCVLRYPDAAVGAMLATLATQAAHNNNIGYDQYQRTTFYTALKAAGWLPENITTKCEADCSSGVAALVIATGHLTGLEPLQKVSPDMYTGNERQALKNAGFEVLTDEKYLTSDKYLMPGDVLLYEGHHTAINLDYGSEVQPPKYDYENLGWNYDGIAYWYATGHYKGQYHCNNIVKMPNKDGEERLWCFDTEGYLVNPTECEMNPDGSIRYIHGIRIKP